MITQWKWVSGGGKGSPPLQVQAETYSSYGFTIVALPPVGAFIADWYVVAHFSTDGSAPVEDERIALDLARIYINGGNSM